MQVRQCCVETAEQVYGMSAEEWEMMNGRMDVCDCCGHECPVSEGKLISVCAACMEDSEDE